MADESIGEKQDAATVEMLRRYQTAESVLLPIPRDAFEKLYLSPKTPAAGNLRRTFGNPTPISLLGFLLAATPAAMLTMGWGNSGGNGGAILPVYIFFGGMVQIFGAVGEWILGNTFSSALFFTYGTFWIVQGTSQIPWYGVGTNYSTTGNSFEGMQTPEFAATTGLYYATLAILTFVYLICSIRTNVCLFLALFLLVITFALTAATFFQMSVGNLAHAATLQKTAGGFNFALCLPIWWIFIAQIFEAVDFPITIPVGDLSTVILGKSQKAKKREAEGQ
ncbi:Putative GPR1/FUN34/YaaH-class plasma membrane protein [Penicillium brasilianum]|uniref:Putative GPR1/FUN34/YaaH-class plasma membrane protein n=1 Tax=Penicillium brasilianum TaxID=104259 RepID=A0A0F7TXK2_PENBI|nr:Putative GPR1/FUN34/YaaH-class plasma membrane protein [Penicillium brasilianum]